jgi:hypothetical protein
MQELDCDAGARLRCRSWIAMQELDCDAGAGLRCRSWIATQKLRPDAGVAHIDAMPDLPCRRNNPCLQCSAYFVLTAF